MLLSCSGLTGNAAQLTTTIQIVATAHLRPDRLMTAELLGVLWHSSAQPAVFELGPHT